MSFDDLSVAVTGLALRLPGSADPVAFWELLCRGEIAVMRRGSAEGFFVPSYGLITRADHFDPERFGMSPREALLLDPQHRLLLTIVDEALATANVDPGRRPSVAVYGALGRNDYLSWVGTALRGEPGTDPLSLELAAGRDYAVSRVAYRLGLRGAALNTQSACASGLVAVHLAVQDLLGLGCDVAVAATAAVRIPNPGGYDALPGGIGSPDGVCRPFDVGANGTVPGDGVVAVVLKRLDDALADGDDVWALIRGSAINNDGADKSGFGGVNASAQRDVVRAALAVSAVSPPDIDYVEAHGSGTRLGDAAEWSAMADVFEGNAGPVRVGALKGSVGHLREAAGLAGLAKVILCLRFGRLVATPTFRRLPDDLAARSDVLLPLAEARDWSPSPGRRRFAGVSAFGLGGTNAHVVLEEAPVAAPVTRRGGLLLVSSHRADTLDADTIALRRRLEAAPDRVGDVAHSTRTAARRMRHRRFVLVSEQRPTDDAFATQTLRAQTTHAAQSDPQVVFVLPGIGSHYPGMAVRLAAADERFGAQLQDVVARADAVADGTVSPQFHPSAAPALCGGTGIDLRAMLGRADGTGRSGTCMNLDLRALHLGLFSVQYALARTLLELGVRPIALLGHSLGEWVAATVAGVLDPDDALAAVARRAQLIETAGPGALLAVLAPADEVESLAEGRAWLAADNGPQHCLFAGSAPDLERLRAELHRRGYTAAAVQGGYAFHTPQLEEAARLLGGDLASVRLRSPRIPLASGVLGRWLEGEAARPDYWRRQLTHRVRFREATRCVLERSRILVEIGPGTVSPWVKQADADAVCIRTMRRAYERVPDEDVLQEALGHLWTHGVTVDWSQLRPPGARLVAAAAPAVHARPFLPDIPPPPATCADSTTAVTGAGQDTATGPAPGSPVEASLRQTWSMLLGLREIRPEDHFFHLGGDSLMGTHLIATLRQALGVAVPGEVIFASALFREMTEEVERWVAGR
jgi:phthiocerol/phenolphthiocerol synthesis type-I polyketide synthase E